MLPMLQMGLSPSVVSLLQEEVGFFELQCACGAVERDTAYFTLEVKVDLSLALRTCPAPVQRHLEVARVEFDAAASGSHQTRALSHRGYALGSHMHFFSK